jgi:hypothetical protein
MSCHGFQCNLDACRQIGIDRFLSVHLYIYSKKAVSLSLLQLPIIRKVACLSSTLRYATLTCYLSRLRASTHR